MQIIILYFILVIIISLLSSCITYMQVQQMSTSENVKMVDHTLQYEDDNCVIYYYLWSEGGNPSFVFYNQSDSNIYLDLASCFFIRNGVAFDYYLQREYGVSESQANVSAARVGGMQTDWVFGQQQGVRIGDYTMAMVNERSRSMVISEKQVLTIPARSMRRISEYDWLNGLYTGCNLNVKPEQGVKSDVTFTRDNTPLVVENRLQYEIEGVQHQVEHEFYLSKVTNMQERDADRKSTRLNSSHIQQDIMPYSA